MLLNWRLLFLAGLAIACNSASSATVLFVSLDTSPLVAHPADPFYLNFQLNDGTGTGDASNTAVLTDFSFGLGGAPAGSPVLSGGASGILTTAVSLTDSSFLNVFTQEFIPGSLLSFKLTLTTNESPGPQPDQFSFAILDSSGFELPYASPFNAALAIDIFPILQVQSYPTDPSAPPFGGGDGIRMAAPHISSDEIPEPSTAITGIALALGCWFLHIRLPGSPRCGRKKAE